MQDVRKKCVFFFFLPVTFLIVSFAAEDIPAFPIQNDVLETVKATVNLARDLDKLELQYKKVQSESGWIQKAAEEMDIIVEDEYPLFSFCFEILLLTCTKNFSLTPF